MNIIPNKKIEINPVIETYVHVEIAKFKLQEKITTQLTKLAVNQTTAKTQLQDLKTLLETPILQANTRKTASEAVSHNKSVLSIIRHMTNSVNDIIARITVKQELIS